MYKKQKESEFLGLYKRKWRPAPCAATEGREGRRPSRNEPSRAGTSGPPPTRGGKTSANGTSVGALEARYCSKRERGFLQVSPTSCEFDQKQNQEFKP